MTKIVRKKENYFVKEFVVIDITFYDRVSDPLVVDVPIVAVVPIIMISLN